MTVGCEVIFCDVITFFAIQIPINILLLASSFFIGSTFFIIIFTIVTLLSIFLLNIFYIWSHTNGALFHNFSIDLAKKVNKLFYWLLLHILHVYFNLLKFIFFLVHSSYIRLLLPMFHTPHLH